MVKTRSSATATLVVRLAPRVFATAKKQSMANKKKPTSILADLTEPDNPKTISLQKTTNRGGFGNNIMSRKDDKKRQRQILEKNPSKILR